jgi:hypothetical protein
MQQLEFDLPLTEREFINPSITLELYRAGILPNTAIRPIRISTSDSVVHLRWVAYVESQQGGGATMRLDLPVGRAEAKHIQANLGTGIAGIYPRLRHIIYDNRSLRAVEESAC